MVMLGGTTRCVDRCQAARSTMSTAWAPGATISAISARQVHRLSVAGRQDQGCTLALFRTDRTEDVGGSGALVPRRAGAGAALGLPPRDLVLLANTGFVCKPDFYLVAVDRLLVRDGI
jgi:hypothetical protein